MHVPHFTFAGIILRIMISPSDISGSVGSTSIEDSKSCSNMSDTESVEHEVSYSMNETTESMKFGGSCSDNVHTDQNGRGKMSHETETVNSMPICMLSESFQEIKLNARRKFYSLDHNIASRCQDLEDDMPGEHDVNGLDKFKRIQAQVRRKYSTTSSVFAQNTISNPNIYQIVFW